MKKTGIMAILAAGALSLGVFAGCSQTCIISIEKSNSVGLDDFYTITYSDGTTSTIKITNGKDGAEGAPAPNVTATDVYETYKSIYGDDMTYKEFCEAYLSFNVDNTAALKSSLLSCLKVYTVFKERVLNTALMRYIATDECYSGSSVIYKIEDDYTYMLTNYHVMYDDAALTAYDKDGDKISDRVYVYLYGSESMPRRSNPNSDFSEIVVDDDYAVQCEYVGGAITYDVAVIRARTEDLLRVNPAIKAVTVNTEFSVGDTTYAVGNPDGAGISVTEGIISVDSDYITLDIDKVERSYREIRTDTAMTHGSSGGGLFNVAGELIGLNNAGDSEVTSMNYSIPASVLKGVADGIIYYAEKDASARCTYKARLCTTSVAKNSRYVYDPATGDGRIIEDVVVDDIEPEDTTEGERVAKKMGLEVGDVLKKLIINGKEYELTRIFHVADLMLGVRIGDEISFEYERGGDILQTSAYTITSENIVKVS